MCMTALRFVRRRCPAWPVVALTSLLTGGALVRADAESAGGASDPLPALPPASLSLREAFRLALKANRTVEVASLDADIAGARAEGPQGAFDPTVFAEAAGAGTDLPSADAGTTGSDTRDGRLSAGLRQRLPTGTTLELAADTEYSDDRTGTAAVDPSHGTGLVLRLRQDLLRDYGRAANQAETSIARNARRMAQHSVEQAVIQALFDTEATYWQLYFALADLEVRRKQLARAEELVRRAKVQVDVGEAPPIETTRAKASAAGQAVAIVNAQSRIARLRHSLLRVMGILDAKRASSAFELSDAPAQDPLKVSLTDAVNTAMRKRPDYLRARVALESAEIRHALAGNQVLPSLEASGQIGLAGLDENLSGSTREVRGGEHASWRLGLLLEWPIPNRRARSERRATLLGVRRAEAQIAALLQEITAEVADAIADLTAASGRSASAGEARDLAAVLLEAEERSFSLGRSDSLDVLNAQASLAAAERDEVRARADYATALANLLRTRGDFLEAKNISFSREDP